MDISLMSSPSLSNVADSFLVRSYIVDGRALQMLSTKCLYHSACLFSPSSHQHRTKRMNTLFIIFHEHHIITREQDASDKKTTLSNDMRARMEINWWKYQRNSCWFFFRVACCYTLYFMVVRLCSQFFLLLNNKGQWISFKRNGK